MITRKFVEMVHAAFDELNYHEQKKLNYDDFEQSAIKTLTHCKELNDAIKSVRMWQFCRKHWKKIEKLFSKKLSVFNEYSYEGNSMISLVSDEDAYGTYYITNGIDKKVKEIYVASCSLNENLLALNYNSGKFSIYNDGDYFLKYARMSSTKMKLFNRKHDCLTNIVLSKGLGVFLENNHTSYELFIYDDFIGIYDKKYLDSLSDSDIVETNKLLADIEWDMLDKNSDCGIARLNVYAPNQDLEMFLFFAASTFLSFQNYISSQKAANFRRMIFFARNR